MGTAWLAWLVGAGAVGRIAEASARLGSVFGSDLALQRGVRWGGKCPRFSRELRR